MVSWISIANLFLIVMGVYYAIPDGASGDPLADLKKENEQLKKENEQLTKEIAEVRSTLGLAKTMLTIRERDNEKLKAEFKSAQKLFETERKQLETELHKAKKAAETAKYQSTPESEMKLIQENERLIQENERLKKDSAGMVKQITRLIDERTEGIRAYESIQSKKENVEAELRKVRQELIKTTEELKTLMISGFNTANLDLVGPMEAISLEILLRPYGGKYGKITENVCQSPMSLFVSFIMILAGMDEATQKKSLEFLSLGDITFDNVLRQTSVILKSAQRNGPDGELKVGSFGFIDSEYYPLIYKLFIINLERYLGTEFKRMEFHNKERLVENINSYVSRETKEKIKHFLPQGSLASLKRYVGIAYMFVDVPWQKCFNEKDTHPGTFYLDNGSEKIMPFMMLTDEILHGGFQDLSCACVILPYMKLERNVQGQYTFLYFLIVRPTDKLGETLEAIEKKKSELGQESLFSYLYSGMEKKKVTVTMPSFKHTSPSWDAIHYAREKLHTDTIIMKELFISGPPYQVNVVYQKSEAEVTEKGTTVSSATASLPPRDMTGPVAYDVNKPFLYYVILQIGDQHIVIAQGVVADPEEIPASESVSTQM